MLIKLLLNLFILNVNSFINIPINTYIKTFNNNRLDYVNVVEPYYSNKYNTTCILFFTGGSSFIVPEIYNNFFRNIASNNVAICVPSFRYSDINNLINILDYKYKEVIIAGHSSGATVALNKCNSNKIKKLILFDPVNTKLFKSNKKYNVENISSVLFMNAIKSYKITYEPFGLPFIPFLRITKSNLNLDKSCKVIVVDANNYGHCDILDKPFANLMHKTRIAVGNKNRSHANINNYHSWISNVLKYFINRNYRNLKYLDNINNTIN